MPHIVKSTILDAPTGAVWKDICRVLSRRWPLVRAVLVSCKVQGDGSAESIVTALRRIEQSLTTSTLA